LNKRTQSPTQSSHTSRAPRRHRTKNLREDTRSMKGGEGYLNIEISSSLLHVLDISTHCMTILVERQTSYSCLMYYYLHQNGLFCVQTIVILTNWYLINFNKLSMNDILPLFPLDIKTNSILLYLVFIDQFIL
jgi:hypothetical protein